MTSKSRPIYLNVTEIRGMPMIIINAYQGLFFILFLVFIRWVVFAVEHTCKMRHIQVNQTPTPTATAHAITMPLRRWINSPLSSRRSTHTSSVFTDDESLESKDDDVDGGTPTASDTRLESTGADATRDNEGLVSYG